MTEADLSNRVVRAMHAHLRQVLGDARTAEIFEGAGLDVSYLEDTDRWISVALLLRFCEQLARRVYGLAALPPIDHPVWAHFREAGRETFRRENVGPLWYALRALGAPALLYARLPSLVERANRLTRIEVVHQAPGLVVLRCTPRNPAGPSLPCMCHARVGTFESVPTLWGLPPARVEHPLCMYDPVDSSDHCLYRVTYREPLVRRWLGAAAPLVGGAGLGAAAAALLGLDVPAAAAAAQGALLALGALGWGQHLSERRIQREGGRQLTAMMGRLDAHYRSLRESEQRFRQLAENVREGFWLSAPELSPMVYASPACGDILGLPAEQIVARPRLVLARVHPDDRQRLVGMLRARGHLGFDETFRLVRPGGEVRHVRARAFPVSGGGGAVRRIAGIAEDITEQVRAREALARQDARLREAQKLEAIGRLAAGVAHDFNNHLTVIQSAAAFALEAVPPGSEAAEALSELLASAGEATAMTRQLLAFGRCHPINLAPLDLSDLVARTVRMLRRLLTPGVALELRPAAGLGQVRADGVQLAQVLMNLVVNACQAMPQGGRLTVATRAVDLAHPLDHAHGRVPRGSFAVLAVTDTGGGIPPEVLPRIFDPFFTTKGAGEGTGLGLATVYAIAEQHGGAVVCRSASGAGTTFEVYLPLGEAAATPLETQSPDESARRAAAQVLPQAVDDASRRARPAASGAGRRSS